MRPAQASARASGPARASAHAAEAAGAASAASSPDPRPHIPVGNGGVSGTRPREFVELSLDEDNPVPIPEASMEWDPYIPPIEANSSQEAAKTLNT